jgi:hypothetical protein
MTLFSSFTSKQDEQENENHELFVFENNIFADLNPPSKFEIVLLENAPKPPNNVTLTQFLRNLHFLN